MRFSRHTLKCTLYKTKPLFLKKGQGISFAVTDYYLTIAVYTPQTNRTKGELRMKITMQQWQDVHDYVLYGMRTESIKTVLLAGLNMLKDTHVAAAYDEHAPQLIRCAHCGAIVKNSECKPAEIPIGQICEEMLICQECYDKEQDMIADMEREANERIDADRLQEAYYAYVDAKAKLPAD